MKGILIIVFSVIISNQIICQEELSDKRKNIYLELLGRGGFFSINYEKIVNDKSIWAVGFGYVPKSTFEDSFLESNQQFIFPISYNYMLDITDRKSVV